MAKRKKKSRKASKKKSKRKASKRKAKKASKKKSKRSKKSKASAKRKGKPKPSKKSKYPRKPNIKKKTAKKPSRKSTKKSTSLKPSKTSESEDPREHRQHPRVPIRLKIDYFQDPNVFLYDYSRNLGRGGLFIETDEPMPAGTEITLSFRLPNQEDSIEVTGQVVWVHKKSNDPSFKGVPGMGIKFVNPEGNNKDALDRFFREIDYDNLKF